MFPTLSSIIGKIRAYFSRRRLAYEARVEAEAKRLFLRMLVEHEDDQVKNKLAELEEKKQLAEAWMPFKTKRLTKGNAKALTYIDDLQIAALETIEEEIRAELSNRAMRADGIQRDKAMWAAVGVRMFMEALKQKIEHFGGQQEREKVKKKMEAERSEKTAPRTMRDLYGERLISATSE